MRKARMIVTLLLIAAFAMGITAYAEMDMANLLGRWEGGVTYVSLEPDTEGVGELILGNTYPAVAEVKLGADGSLLVAYEMVEADDTDEPADPAFEEDEFLKVIYADGKLAVDPTSLDAEDAAMLSSFDMWLEPVGEEIALKGTVAVVEDGATLTLSFELYPEGTGHKLEEPIYNESMQALMDMMSAADAAEDAAEDATED